MACGNNANLDAIKSKTEELSSLLQAGKDELASMSSKLGELTAELNSFKPTLPEFPNLQKELSALINISDPFGFASKLAEINETDSYVILAKNNGEKQ